MAPLPDDERRYADELRVHDRDTEGLPEHDRMMLRHRFLRGLGGPPGRALALSDDAGTDYRSVGGGSSGGGDELTGRARFVPGIPPEASVADGALGGARVPGAARRPGWRRDRLTPGWVAPGGSE